jgi:chemotaxis protein CheD
MDKIMEDNLIEVQMGRTEIGKGPQKLITRGLGSCLGITFWDHVKKIGGMAHPMLPDFDKAKTKNNPSRFVNSAIFSMIESFEEKGCLKMRLEIKIFGGAHMFSFINTDSVLNVGQKNIEMAHSVFKELGLEPLIEEVGGTFGRTIELNCETGKVLIKTVSWGDKEV